MSFPWECQSFKDFLLIVSFLSARNFLTNYNGYRITHFFKIFGLNVMLGYMECFFYDGNGNMRKNEGIDDYH